MIRNYAFTVRGWALGLSTAGLVTGFLIANINTFNTSLIYLSLFVAVISAGLLTNIWGGLAASGVAVFALAILNQYVGIYPLQNRILNLATELAIFLAAGPAAGWLSRVIEGGEQRLHHWTSLAEARATHDKTFNTLKPEWLQLRLEEEMVRARRFARPLSLGVLQFDDLSRVSSAERVAALQALVRIARTAALPPAIVACTDGSRVLLVLPEHSPDQARQVLSTVERRAGSEHFFTRGTPALGRPLHELGPIHMAVVDLRPDHEGPEALLQDAVLAVQP